MTPITIESTSSSAPNKKNGINRILVASDFSENAKKAVNYAAEMATKSDATLMLLHVIEPEGINLKQHYTPFYNSYLQGANNSGLWELDSIRNSLYFTYPNIKIETQVVEGEISDCIVAFAEMNEIDL